MEQGYVYILECTNGRYYVGSTNDLARRIDEHKNGKSAATKNVLPVTLVFSETFDSVKTARQVEYKLKKNKSRKIIEQIIEDGRIKFAY